MVRQHLLSGNNIVRQSVSGVRPAYSMKKEGLRSEVLFLFVTH